MPQRKQPRALLDMSVDVYTNLYLNVCNTWNSNLDVAMRIRRRDYRRVKRTVVAEMEQIKEILSEVAPSIQSIICSRLASSFANNIMSYYNRMESDIELIILREVRHGDLCVAMFRSVLTRYLYEYEPRIISNSFTQNLVVQTLDSVPGLKTLRLPRIYSTNVSAQVATSIPHLSNLQVFEYTRHCTDAVVMQLALHCADLTEVSLLHSDGVTNNSVPYLLRLRKLKFLNLRGTQINSTHYGLLLSQLPKIADIRFANKEDDVLLHIAPETVNTITHVYGIVNDINMQIQKFPKTTNFVVSMPDVDLSGLTAWTELRTLELSLGNGPTLNLHAILAGIGHKLTELKLTMISDVNLEDIITLCDSLRSLSLRMCIFLPLNADAPLNPQLPHFRYLISLQIERIQVDVTDYNYIRNYVNLEKIELIWIDIFTAEFMMEILRRGTLANLRECYIQETRQGALTYEVLKLLIEHCSHLRIFGNTRQLHRLNPNNIEELNREMLVQNFDFNIMS